MTNIRISGLGFIVLSTLVLSGCVSKSAYEELQREALETERIKDETGEKLTSAEARLRQQMAIINDLQKRLGKVTTNKAELDRSLAETREALSDLAKRKEETEKELREFKNLTAGLKSMIDTGSVTVSFIKGRMVVSLGSDVLFGSGSAKLSADGIEAVKQVTKQLVLIKDKDFQIEGHTDNVPIKTREFPSNWELASARALTVVNAMMAAGMPSDRVSAASYGDTRPTASNDTGETRAKNRRIDMVIVPDLSKLMNVGANDKPVKADKRDVAADKKPEPAAEAVEKTEPAKEDKPEAASAPEEKTEAPAN